MPAKHLVSYLIGTAFLGSTFLAFLVFFDVIRVERVVKGTTELVKVEETSVPRASVTVTFTGDIMLARDVENRLIAGGPGFALASIKEQLYADMVVGNFESSIPEIHQKTETMEMRFSVLPELVGELVGTFTHLSLANNHALDHGHAGYANTVKVLEGNGLEASGHPSRIATSSVMTKEFSSRKVAIVNLNATYGYLDIEDVVPAIPSSLKSDDLLVAYVHWGQEYELIHDEWQEEFAHSLIDAGFDLVVGHHPHVVQDIERYRDGLIFYSLGNFIFDQYWRPEVREGLVLNLTEGEDGWSIGLMPVESETIRVQPRAMTGERRKGFLEELAGRSSKNLDTEIRAGGLSLQF